jgi:hypothetical protein
MLTEKKVTCKAALVATKEEKIAADPLRRVDQEHQGAEDQKAVTSSNG